MQKLTNELTNHVDICLNIIYQQLQLLLIYLLETQQKHIVVEFTQLISVYLSLAFITTTEFLVFLEDVG